MIMEETIKGLYVRLYPLEMIVTAKRLLFAAWSRPTSPTEDRKEKGPTNITKWTKREKHSDSLRQRWRHHTSSIRWRWGSTLTREIKVDRYHLWMRDERWRRLKVQVKDDVDGKDDCYQWEGGKVASGMWFKRWDKTYRLLLRRLLWPCWLIWFGLGWVALGWVGLGWVGLIEIERWWCDEVDVYEQQAGGARGGMSLWKDSKGGKDAHTTPWSFLPWSSLAPVLEDYSEKPVSSLPGLFILAMLNQSFDTSFTKTPFFSSFSALSFFVSFLRASRWPSFPLPTPSFHLSPLPHLITGRHRSLPHPNPSSNFRFPTQHRFSRCQRSRWTR